MPQEVREGGIFDGRGLSGGFLGRELILTGSREDSKVHKRYKKALAEYERRKAQKREDGEREKRRTIFKGEIREEIIMNPEVRASKEFIIHGFDEALERYKAQKRKKRDKSLAAHISD